MCQGILLVFSTGITVMEQLTAHRQRLMATASSLVKDEKLLSAWTVDGRIFVKSHDGNIKDIHKETDLIGF